MQNANKKMRIREEKIRCCFLFSLDQIRAKNKRMKERKNERKKE